MKNKKKLILTTILSVVCVVVLILGFILVNNHFKSVSDGEIRITLVDLEKNTISDKKIEFKEGDTIDMILKENYDNVVFENGMIMSIESMTTAPDWSYFISIYVNGEMSQVGLFDIPFTDGMWISFEMTEFVYE